MNYVNLHVHTSLGSMQDSLISVDDLFNRALELKQNAVAITDHGTMAAVYDAWKAYKRTGVKFIPGCEGYFVHSYDVKDGVVSGRKRRKNEKRKHITLLAKNATGYKNLLKAFYEGFQRKELQLGYVYPRLSWDILEQYSEGVICLSGCGSGILAEKLMLGDIEGAEKMALRLSSIFSNNFYLELQPHHLKNERIDQEWINESLIEFSKKLNIPLVVTTDSHYLTREGAKYHDMLLAIRSKKPLKDKNRMSYGIEEFYLKTAEEIYDFLADKYGKIVAISAIENTQKIADSCENPDYLEVKGHHLPDFPCKDEQDYSEFFKWLERNKSCQNIEEAAAFMRFRCFKAFKEKFSHLSNKEKKYYWERIKYEIKILENNKFSSYMLVVSDYIRWAENNDILVGVGRGSVAGSLVAYLLDIHRVNPFDFGLLFERFQNAEKTDLPDIDTDFMSTGREKVEQYVRDKYGHENCAHVSNFTNYTPKNTIDDVARSLRIGSEDDDDKNYFFIAKTIKDSIPDDAENFNDAKERSQKFKMFCDKYPELLEYSERILGKEKTYSTHAAGVVISDIPIYNFAPIRIDKNDVVAVQYEKNRCEANGLVKMDFLGLTTLDVIDETLKNIKRINLDGPKKMKDIPLDDRKTYEMISNGNTKCVFQLGSTTMISLCKRIKPKNILDIAIINALGRPSSGPRELEDGTVYNERDEYIKRRDGLAPITYLHPSLKCLEETLGLCMFEEQLMGVAKHCADWDLNKADKLRKFTKLKNKGADLAKQLRKDFINGFIKKHNSSLKEAEIVWTGVVEKFGGYGFNRSHAVSYSINGYYTAYLKCHYPTAFLAAKLKVETASNSIASEGEIESAKQECKRLGIKILPPNINEGSYEVLDDKTIVMGLLAIKGLGAKASEDILLKQPFDSFLDFLHRTESRIVNKSKIEALAKAGCFDLFNLSRKFVFEEAKTTRDKLVKYLNTLKKKHKDGYDSECAALSDFPFSPKKEEWSVEELLRNEYETLGTCLSGNLNDLYNGFFIGYNITPLSKIAFLPNKHNVNVEILVKSVIKEITIKKPGKNKGKKMLKYLVEDIEGASTELTIWPTQYAIAKKYISDKTPIRAQCQVSDFNGQKSLSIVAFQEIYGVKK